MTKRVQILEEEEENGEGGYFDEGDDEDDYYEGYANEYDEAMLMLIIVSPRVVSLLNRNKRKGIKIENLLLGRRVTLMMIKNFK
jgi:hypothetical protein